jgi:hypothetical protein
MIEVTVIIRGERVPVSVTRRSKEVWIARGEYQGHFIETEGRRDRFALARWREIAERRAA